MGNGSFNNFATPSGRNASKPNGRIFMDVFSTFAMLVERVTGLRIEIPNQKMEEIQNLWRTKYPSENYSKNALTTKQI